MSEPLDNDTIFNSLKTRLESDQAVWQGPWRFFLLT
jgi:hypothetical protein